MIKVVTELLKTPIGYHAVLAKCLRSVPAAVMLSQGIYWQRIANEKGKDWFWVTSEEWFNQTGVTEESQLTARKVLKGAGVWNERLMELPAKMHYQIDVHALVAVLSRYLETGETVAGVSRNKQRYSTRTSGGKFGQQDPVDPGDKKTNEETILETNEETTISAAKAPDQALFKNIRHSVKFVDDEKIKKDFAAPAKKSEPWTKVVATIFDEINQKKHSDHHLEYLPFNWQVCAEENFKQLKNLREKAIGPDFKTKWGRVASEDDLITSFRAVFGVAWDYFYDIQKKTSGPLCFTPTNIYKSYNKIKSSKNGNSKNSASSKSAFGRGIDDNGNFDQRAGY